MPYGGKIEKKKMKENIDWLLNSLLYHVKVPFVNRCAFK